METSQYLDRVLAKYAGSFDIEKNYTLGDDTWSAYAYFFSLGEKYVLTRKAKLWSICAYEYVLFQETERCTSELLDRLYAALTVRIEEDCVRKGARYPEKDHMYSYLSAVVISRFSPDEEVLRHIRELRFDKGYLLSFRGHSEFHLVVVDLEREKVYTNPAAGKMKKVYRKAFDEIRQGAKGYTELYVTGEALRPAEADEDVLPL